MVWWWWIVPAAVAALGAVWFLLAVIGLFRGRILSGIFGSLAGAGLLAAASIAVLLGQNAQTYGRLTYERPVATLSTRQLAPQYFEVTVTQPALGDAAERTAVYPVNGDEWRVEAQVLRWKPWANVLGLDAQYRLDRLSGRYQSIDQERSGARSVHALSSDADPDGLPWSLSLWDTARKYRGYIDPVDTLYGSGAYMAMQDGATYEVWITQSGLVARPTNAAAREASSGGWVVVN